MPKKSVDPAQPTPEHWFVKELAGEAPPSFAALRELYELSSEWYRLQPWTRVDESELILTPHPSGGQICYCSNMGSAGEVFSLQAYIGPESYRLFRRMALQELESPIELLAGLNGVCLEFVRASELTPQDRRLLAALGHVSKRGARTPIFRANRPGSHPWFVNAEEARALAACIRAVNFIASALVPGVPGSHWNRPDFYPLVSPDKRSNNELQLEFIHAPIPPEAPVPAARIGEEDLRQLRNRDYQVRGEIELDFVESFAAVGKPSGRKTCTAIALAVDAVTGIVFPPEMVELGAPVGDILAKVLFKTIQSTGFVPKRVRVRNHRLKECLKPVADALAVEITVPRSLPALDAAREHLLAFL